MLKNLNYKPREPHRRPSYERYRLGIVDKKKLSKYEKAELQLFAKMKEAWEENRTMPEMKFVVELYPAFENQAKQYPFIGFEVIEGAWASQVQILIENNGVQQLHSKHSYKLVKPTREDICDYQMRKEIGL